MNLVSENSVGKNIIFYNNVLSPRSTNNDGINLLKSFESFSSTTYICPSGYKTIGYGHVILKGENFTSISKEEANLILKSDIAKAENAVLRNISVDLNDSQFAALVCFTFNLGSGALQSSTLRHKVNYDSTMPEIYNEFLRWVYAGGKKLKGLERRRIAEADLYFSEIYSS